MRIDSSGVSPLFLLVVNVIAFLFPLFLSVQKGLAFDCPSGVGKINPSECESIKEVYEATGGSTKWDCGNRGNPDPFFDRLYCGVYIKCSGTNATANRHVTAISLPYCNMTGVLPADAFSKIPYLYYLNLGENNLTGSIPESLSSLKYLNYLDLGHNQLTGTIPNNLLGDQTSTTVPSPFVTPITPKLSVRDNNLQGPLPQEIGRNDLQFLLFDENSHLSGPVPQTYTEQTNKAYLMFDYSDTTVCEPQNITMQTWLNSIINHIGTNIICGTSPPPTTPKSLSASDGASDKNVIVKWKKSSSSTEKYYVERSENRIIWEKLGKINHIDKSIYAFYDKSATPLTAYYYRVKACNYSNKCSQYSNLDQGYKKLQMPEPIVDKVSKLKGQPARYKINFTWTDTIRNNSEDYYKLFASDRRGFHTTFIQWKFSYIQYPQNNSYSYSEKSKKDAIFSQLTKNAIAVQACGIVKNTDYVLDCSPAALLNRNLSMSGIFRLLLQPGK